MLESAVPPYLMIHSAVRDGSTFKHYLTGWFLGDDCHNLFNVLSIMAQLSVER